MWFPCGRNSYVLEDGRRLRSGGPRAVAYLYSTEREVGVFRQAEVNRGRPAFATSNYGIFGTNISIDVMTKLKMEYGVREARALS